MIDVFLSRPNWVPNRIDKHFSEFYPLLTEMGFNPRTIGSSEVPLTFPVQEVIQLMHKCQCTIVLGIPQIWVESGKLKDKKIDKRFSLPTEWNQIEATISIMLNKPTLMMLHKGVAARGVFERGAANVFVHDFETLSGRWVEKTRPMLKSLRDSVNHE